MSNNSLFVAVLVLICYSGYCSAFGAGNIPSVAFLEGKAFRHGDIEDILAEMLIRAANSNISTGFAAKAVGRKFSDLNVKRVYFGNWLRDYSQAIDVGTLSKGLDIATIRILVWIFGFLSFGYATVEFEVTGERLGVYRPEEHIDNPKDYADNVDARQFDQRLRGPVDPREIQIDQRTGMKNYIANEQGGWATSTKYIRDSLLKAIDLGRRATVDAERYEALRLLGQALHTLEDLTAHSNWIELSLIELGYTTIFPHVGSATQITLPNGKRVWPMITGTFGGVDFIHSLLGELSDHVSQTSVTDLNAAITEAEHQNSQELYDKLKGLLALVPSGQNDLEGIQASAVGLSGGVPQGQWHLQGMQGEGPAVSAEEIVKTIYPIFALRDKIMKTIVTVIDKIPGLKATVEEIKTNLTFYVLSLIQPIIKPILRLITENVSKSSALVMSDQAQYLVWNDPNSSDPTHSMLSKDHFSCYLNEPAGNVAKVIIQNAVTQVVAAWSNTTISPSAAIDSTLACFTHPALLNPQLKLHNDMLEVVKNWMDTLPESKKQRVLRGLTREGVRQGLHHDDETSKQGQQTFGGTSEQTITMGVPSISSSVLAMNGPSSIGVSTSSSRIGTQIYSSGYSSSSYQSYTSAQRGASSSSGTSYAQGMMTDSAYGTSGKTVEYRMWPYNMDYYTRQDHYSLKHLSPYYQSMPSILQSSNIFGIGQATYIPPGASLYTSSTSLTSNLITSNQSSGSQSSLSGPGTGAGQYLTNLGQTLPSGAGSGSGYPTTSLGSSSTTLGNAYQGMAPLPQQLPLTSTSTQSFPSGSGSGGQYPTSLASSSGTSLGTSSYSGLGMSTTTTSINSSINPVSGTAVPITTSTPLSTTVPGPAPPTGQGTNSSYYGQVTNHGQGSPTLTSPTLASQPSSPVQAVSPIQGSMQNMNIHV